MATVGTVLYAAPEQLTGKDLDGRADQYALAVTAFHLLAGKPPFAHSNPAVVIGKHLSASPPKLARLRPDLAPIDGVLARAMAKKPLRRFDTCRDFAAALADAVAGSTSSAEPTQVATPIPTPQRDTPDLRLAMIAGGIAALIAVGVVAYIGARLAPAFLGAANYGRALPQRNTDCNGNNGAARDRDPHAATGDDHPIRGAAERQHPCSHNDCTGESRRRSRAGYPHQQPGVQWPGDRRVGVGHHPGLICGRRAASARRAPGCFLPSHRSVV